MKRNQVQPPASPRGAEEWARVIEDWRRTEPQPATRKFCRDRGLTVKTFQWWRWALLRRGSSPHRASSLLMATSSPSAARSSEHAVATPAFIEIVAASRTTSSAASPRRRSGVEVLVAGPRGDRRVRIDVEFDATTLLKVVAALEEVESSC